MLDHQRIAHIGQFFRQQYLAARRGNQVAPAGKHHIDAGAAGTGVVLALGLGTVDIFGQAIRQGDLHLIAERRSKPSVRPVDGIRCRIQQVQHFLRGIIRADIRCDQPGLGSIIPKRCGALAHVQGKLLHLAVHGDLDGIAARLGFQRDRQVSHPAIAGRAGTEAGIRQFCRQAWLGIRLLARYLYGHNATRRNSLGIQPHGSLNRYIKCELIGLVARNCRFALVTLAAADHQLGGVAAGRGKAVGGKFLGAAAEHFLLVLVLNGHFGAAVRRGHPQRHGAAAKIRFQRCGSAGKCLGIGTLKVVACHRHLPMIRHGVQLLARHCYRNGRNHIRRGLFVQPVYAACGDHTRQQHHQQQPADQQPHGAAHFAASRFRRICLFLRLFCFGILDLFNRNLDRSGDLRLAPLCCSALFRGQFRFVIPRLRRLRGLGQLRGFGFLHRLFRHFRRGGCFSRFGHSGRFRRLRFFRRFRGFRPGLNILLRFCFRLGGSLFAAAFAACLPAARRFGLGCHLFRGGSFGLLGLFRLRFWFLR